MLTVGRDSDDGEKDLVLGRVLVADADRRVGDDDPGVLLHVDAADRHHGLPVLFALLQEETQTALSDHDKLLDFFIFNHRSPAFMLCRKSLTHT